MRVIVALSAILLLAGNAAEGATAQGNRMAYDATLKCAVANGVAEIDERNAHHPDRAAEFEANSRRAFNLAYTLGAKVGLSDKQVLHDLNAGRETELPKMMHDRSYYLSQVAICKAMGLMSD